MRVTTEFVIMIS